MLAGHVAAGFLGKRFAPSVSLGTAVLAALTADLVWSVLLIAGIERFDIVRRGSTLMTSDVVTGISYSHSLLMDAVWAALFAGLYFVLRRDRRGTWVLAGAVLSHWLLDFVAHRPDMPLAPGSRRYFGLGLWTSIPATLAVEGGLWLLAVILYLLATRANRRSVHYVLWVGVALITAAWYNNIAGPPPATSNPAAGIASLVFFSLVTAWAFWINRLRPAAD
jgi:membrane-bound metal-dependent hydrolase YbcI (DUF457 family)